MENKSTLKILILSSLILINVNFALAACDDGRTPCSHKCSDFQRPKCKDSKGSDGKPYCVTPRFCRDNKVNRSGSTQNNCDAGWSTRDKGCSKKQRKRGCKDSRGKISGYCIKY